MVEKKRAMTGGQVFGLVLLILGFGLDACFISIAYLAGVATYYESEIGILTLIIPSFLIFLGVMFLVFVKREEKLADNLE